MVGKERSREAHEWWAGLQIEAPGGHIYPQPRTSAVPVQTQPWISVVSLRPSQFVSGEVATGNIILSTNGRRSKSQAIFEKKE